MAIYSHSKLASFEQCKLKYKLRYIDKIKPETEKSIEAHLGTCVHNSFEWLYTEVINGKIPELNEVIEKYATEWQENYQEKFLIVKKELTAKDYFNKGVKFIVDYYMKHHPFQDGTLELEKKIWITLDKNFPHKIIGYIDRLVYNKEKNEYEIHDYKTANTLPPKEKFDSDRQLALYGIGIKQLFGQEKKITLTWHYLNHNTQIFSTRTDEELEKLRENTIKLIQEIENTKEFPGKKSILCDWCEYKTMCPLFGNQLPQKAKEQQSDLTNISEKFPTASKYIK